MKDNILKLYVIKAIGWFLLIMPIVVPFYVSNGLSMHEVFLLQAAYSIIIVLFEIPSGYLADLFGRKKTIVFGVILDFIGFFIYASSTSFSGFLIAEIILGLGQSMVSGADSALLYESVLEKKGDSKEYTRYEGRLTSIGNFSESIAGITGGFIAIISFRMPYIVQTAIAFLAIPIAFTLHEPRMYLANTKPNWIQFKSFLAEAFYKNKQLSSVILFSSITGACTLTLAWVVQPFFKNIEVPIMYYGVLWTIINFSVGIASLFAYKAEQAFSLQLNFIFIAVFLPICYLFLGVSSIGYWGLLVILVGYLIRGFASPIFKNEINKYTTIANRATILSVRNFLIRVVFSVIGPLTGWLMDVYSFSKAMVLIGLIYSVLMIVSSLFASQILINKKSTQ